jgi:integrase
MAAKHVFKDQGQVDKFKIRDADYQASDTKQPGLRLLVRATGKKIWLVYHRVNGIQEKVTIGPADLINLKDARVRAKKALLKGIDGVLVNVEKEAEREKARLAREGTFEAVAKGYLEDKKGGNLRTLHQRERFLERLVYPVLGRRPIDQILRGEVKRLLDRIKRENGNRSAEYVASCLRNVFDFHALNTDTFTSPMVKGMVSSNEARARILDDAELKAVWDAAGAAGIFGTYVRLLILTAARKSELARLEWTELAANGDWTLPASKNKTKLDLIRPLSPTARALISTISPIGGCRYVFTTNGAQAINGFGFWKPRIDAASGVKGWTLHDLRRTARSLMTRAKVPPDHGERCLGHAIPGIRGICDRHDFYDEKKRAYEALDGLVARIVDPIDNVTALHD